MFELPTWQHAEIFNIINCALGLGSDDNQVIVEDPTGKEITIATFATAHDASAFTSTLCWYLDIEDITDVLYREERPSNGPNKQRGSNEDLEDHSSFQRDRPPNVGLTS